MYQPLAAQSKDSPIAFANQDAIVTTLVQAPNLSSPDSASSNTPPSGDAGKWLKVEIHYGTTANMTKNYPFVDSVQLKVWIEAFDLYAKDAPVPGKGISVVLTGDVTYINIAANKDVYGVFYVPPSVLARYASERGVSDFTRKFNIHAEAYANGTLVDLIDKNKEQDPKWFSPIRAVSGLVLTQDISPFLATDVYRYPMIKPKTGSP